MSGTGGLRWHRTRARRGVPNGVVAHGPSVPEVACRRYRIWQRTCRGHPRCHQETGLAAQVWEEHIKGHGFAEFDCRHWLQKEPVTKVAHSDDGLSTATQTAVFSSEGFDELMRELVDCAWVNQKISLACRAGLHRSQTAGRFLESILNQVVDVNGKRVYNARHFTLGRVTDSRHIDRVLTDARRWYQSPWCVAVQPASESDVFGHQTAMQSSFTADVWRGILQYVGEQYSGYDVTEQEWYEGPPAAAAEPAAKKPRPEGPRQPAVPPPPPLDVKASGPVRKPWQQPAQRPPQPQLAGPGQRVGQCPPWVTFNQDATVWASVLQEAGVDSIAQQELFLLSTHSREGWEAANALIAKILKKTSDRAKLDNPSAFIHVCCTKARNKITGGWGPLDPEI